MVRPKRKNSAELPASPQTAQKKSRQQPPPPLPDDESQPPPNPAVPPTPPEDELQVQLVPPSPACPGQAKPRDSGPLARIPSGSDLVDVFSNLREDKDLSNEQAFLYFISHFDVSTVTLSNAISDSRLDVSFSNVTFKAVAPYVWLDPQAGGQDISHLDVFRCRIPKDVFCDICQDVDKALCLYGPIHSHENEEARSRFIASTFGTVVSLFRGSVVNKPEGLLEGDFTRNGRIEHHFLALDAISIVFIQVKRHLATGKKRLDTKAQVLAECAACDHLNQMNGFNVPLLAILCDGLNFEYIAYDASEKQVHSSGLTVGMVVHEVGGMEEFIVSLKKTTETILDWFVMGYINAIRAFWSRSTENASKKPENSEKWSSCLAAAEVAHALLRQAAKAASDQDLERAERLATSGFDQIKKSVTTIPGRTPATKLGSVWDGRKCLEQSFTEGILF